MFWDKKIMAVERLWVLCISNTLEEREMVVQKPSARIRGGTRYMKKLYDAICPRCGRNHKAKLSTGKCDVTTFWAGKGIPPLYCKSCKRKIGIIYDPKQPGMDRAVAERGCG